VNISTGKSRFSGGDLQAARNGEIISFNTCLHLLFILFFDSYNVCSFFVQLKEINDIKLLLRVLKMYIPLPVFWALFHQQVKYFIF